MNNLDGKVAIVTGGATPIGAALVNLLRADGVMMARAVRPLMQSAGGGAIVNSDGDIAMNASTGRTNASSTATRSRGRKTVNRVAVCG